MEYGDETRGLYGEAKKSGERVDIPVVQKHPSEGAEGVEVGALWGEGMEQKTDGGLGEGWDGVMG